MYVYNVHMYVHCIYCTYIHLYCIVLYVYCNCYVCILFSYRVTILLILQSNKCLWQCIIVRTCLTCISQKKKGSVTLSPWTMCCLMIPLSRTTVITSAYVFIYGHVCMYVRICTCVCVHVHMYVYMYVCVYVCMFVCMYTCTCMCMYVRIRTSTKWITKVLYVCT